jgi:hypothetical protein
MSPDEGCLLYPGFPKPVTASVRSTAAKGQAMPSSKGNRQWVSGQLTPAANRATAAAGMSRSAKTRFRSGSTAQVSGLTRVMTAS